MEINNPIINRVNDYDNLISLCRVIKQQVTSENSISISDIEDKMDNLKDILNKIFPTRDCVEVTFNYENYANNPFGIMVDPILPENKLSDIFLTDNDVIIENYYVEIDSNIFNVLDAEEIAAYIVEEIYGIVGPEVIPSLRALIDISIYRTGHEITCRDITSIDKMALIVFGVKDMIQKNGSLLDKDWELVGANVFAQAFDTKEILRNVITKIKSSFGIMSGEPANKTTFFKWIITNCKNFEENFNILRDKFIKARDCTPSQLVKNDIDYILRYIDTFIDESYVEEHSKIILESIPFFSKLKRNGLRQIEDDLYEFKVRVKNCEVQDDALYIMRQINSRIAILDDYVLNADISDYEREKYVDLIMKFRGLREDIGKKTIKYKKSYGIFVDYDKLDAMDM